MTHFVAIWIDHNEARALALPTDGVGHTVLAELRAQDLHTHPKHADGHRHPVERQLLASVTEVVAKADEVVLLGPAGAKDELIAHLEATHPDLRARVVAVATFDRATDGELATHARELFARSDRMRGVPVPPARR